MEEADKLDFLRAESAREQEFYWLRFASFSALHAGLLVVAGDKLGQFRLLPIAGLVLAFIWLFIQLASRHYAHRVKPSFHELRVKAGLSYPSHWLFKYGWTASTNIALLVPAALVGLWVHIAFSSWCVTIFVLALVIFWVAIEVFKTNKKTS